MKQKINNGTDINNYIYKSWKILDEFLTSELSLTADELPVTERTKIQDSVTNNPISTTPVNFQL